MASRVLRPYQHISALTSIKNVLTLACKKGVIAFSAKKSVVATTPLKRIITISTIQHVVFPITDNDVTISCADYIFNAGYLVKKLIVTVPKSAPASLEANNNALTR